MSEWNRPASCLLIIGNISSSWEGGKTQFAAPQDKKFILGCCGFRLVCGFNVCLSFFAVRKPGGRRIWDSICGQDGKPKQMSGVKNSFNWQVKEVCSIGLWWFWQMAFCPCHCVTADMEGLSWWNPASQDCFLRDCFFFLGFLKFLQHNRLEGQEE